MRSQVWMLIEHSETTLVGRWPYSPSDDFMMFCEHCDSTPEPDRADYDGVALCCVCFEVSTSLANGDGPRRLVQHPPNARRSSAAPSFSYQQ